MDNYVHQNNIFWFDISMKNFVLMHKTNSIKQISNDERSALFRQGLPSWNDIIKLSITAKFKHGIKIILICEISISFNDVGVVEEALNLKFSRKLNQ
jgi:hypothetical protein